MPSTSTSVIDGLSTSVAVKAPCRAVATTNITLSGLQTVGGVVLVEDDRVLVTAQTSSVDNGIYAASTGQWQRTQDADGNRDLVCGTLVLVQGTSDGIGYELVTADPIVIGTSLLVFEERDLDSALRAELAAGGTGLVGSAALVYVRTALEITDSVTPVNTRYPDGDVRRFLSSLSYAGNNWFCYGQTATRINNTTFTIPGDYRTRYYISSRIRITDNAGGVFEGRVQNVTFGTVTRIVVQSDGGVGFLGNVPATITSLCREELVGQHANSSFLYNADGISTQGPLVWNRSNNSASVAEFRVFIGTAAGGNNADGEPIFGADTGLAIRVTHSTSASPLISLAPTGATAVIHTGEPTPVVIGVNDQTRAIFRNLNSPTAFLGSSEAIEIISTREGDSLGGCWFSFKRSAAQGSNRKGYIGFSNDGSNNTLNVINEVASSNIKLDAPQTIWLANAGGNTGAIFIDSAANMGIYNGTGSPNGVVTANPGSEYFNSSGGANVAHYRKESGVGTNSGWIGK